MELILLILLLVVVFGGGWGYYGGVYPAPARGPIVTILVILAVVLLFGLFVPAFVPHHYGWGW